MLRFRLEGNLLPLTRIKRYTTIINNKKTKEVTMKIRIQKRKKDFSVLGMFFLIAFVSVVMFLSIYLGARYLDAHTLSFCRLTLFGGTMISFLIAGFVLEYEITIEKSAKKKISKKKELQSAMKEEEKEIRKEIKEYSKRHRGRANERNKRFKK